VADTDTELPGNCELNSPYPPVTPLISKFAVNSASVVTPCAAGNLNHDIWGFDDDDTGSTMELSFEHPKKNNPAKKAANKENVSYFYSSL